MEGNFPEKLLGICVTARNCREALMEQGERLHPVNGPSQRRRKRGRVARKVGGGKPVQPQSPFSFCREER